MPLLIISAYLKTNPLAYMDEEAPYYLWNKEKCNATQKERYDVIILGDSVANAAYVPSILSDKTINLALGGTSPLENYYVLEGWLKNNPAPKACYISFADFHFERADCFWERTIYTHRFRPEINWKMLEAAIKDKDPSVLKKHYMEDFIFYQSWAPNRYVSALKYAKFNQNYATNMAIKQKVELHQGRYVTRGIREYSPINDVVYESFSVNPLFDEYYRRILDLCEENQIQVRILKLPQPSNVKYAETYNDSFWEYYDELKKDYPNISVDWLESYGLDCFADDNHMNSRGALQFSTELKELYPEDFASLKMSPNQIAAINDEIITENKIAWILKWISGRNYTVMIADTSGMFPQIYENEIKGDVWDGGPELHRLEARGDSLSDIYYLFGDADRAGGFSDTQNKENMEKVLEIIGTGGGTSEDRLDLFVIDHYNDTIVCQKTYYYMNQEYVYEQ